MLSCSEDKNPVTTGENPVISKVKLQDKWNTQSSTLYKSEVWVNDPQGLSNLSGVYLTVHRSSDGEEIFSDSLYDEGQLCYTDSAIKYIKSNLYHHTEREIYQRR